jgi:hypothetical protein
VLSLCPEAVSGIGSLPSSAESVTATQVRLLSISNTLSRLLSGPLADFISPLTTHVPRDAPSRLPSYRISRVMLLSGISLLLAGTFLYLELAIRTPDSLRVLRYVVMTQFEFAHYSMDLSVLVPVLRTVPHSQFCALAFLVSPPFHHSHFSLTRPSIVSSVWGNSDFGRNFGIITYAPLIGTPLFSYLYAFVSAHNNVGGGVCAGVSCWSPTFWVSTGATLLSFVASVLLWRRWKELV